MSRKAVVNHDPSSDGYKFASFIILHYGKLSKGYKDFYKLAELTPLNKFETKDKLFIQKNLLKAGKGHLWPELEKKLSGYVSDEGIKIKAEDYLQLQTRLYNLEKRVKALETK